MEQRRNGQQESSNADMSTVNEEGRESHPAPCNRGNHVSLSRYRPQIPTNQLIGESAGFQLGSSLLLVVLAYAENARNLGTDFLEFSATPTL